MELLNRLDHPVVAALDLDGTLLRTDKSLSPRTRALLDRLAPAGILPVITTARPPRSTRRLLDGALPSAPWVCYSGAWVTVNGGRVAHEPIHLDLARSAVASLHRAAPNAVLTVEIEDCLYASRPFEFDQPYELFDVDRPLQSAPIKIMLDLTESSAPPDPFAHLPAGLRTFAVDNGKLGIAMADRITKSTGLGHVLSHLGLSFAHVIAFGDEDNDLDLIENAAVGVAMANAPCAVRSLADLVAPSNDDDGVAHVLEQLLAAL